jgi:hypothetical protein
VLKILALTAAAFVAAASAASAATLNLSIVVLGTSPTISTGITCPLAATYPGPLAPGTVICPITVTPAGWAGAVTLTGTGASLFMVDAAGAHVVVGPAAVPAGTYALTMTSTP